MSNRTKATFWTQYGAWVLIAMMTLVALCAIVLVLKISGLNDRPSWWDQQLGESEQAVQLENAITTQMTAVRPDDKRQWSAALTANDINTWMQHRLRSTIETHQGSGAWPTEIETLRVSIVDDTMLFGALVNHSSGNSYLWSEIDLHVQNETLLVTIRSPRVGSTRLPTRVARSVLKQSLTKELDATLDLGDGRTAKIIAVRIHEGRVELVMTTTPSDS